MAASRYRLGIDVGGTFTDAVLVDTQSGKVERGKVLSTPDDPSKGTMQALDSFGVPVDSIGFFCHGSTVGINALIQRRGAKVALICTQGTRDMLDMGRLRRPYGDDLYDPTWMRPHQANPIVPRRHIREVAARMLYDGSVYIDLDEDAARREIEFLRDEGVEAVAVCLLHAWKNLAHEERLVELIREVHPQAYVQWSGLRPVYGEYSRTLSVVLDAYTGPLIVRYLGRLAEALSRAGFPGEVLIMQMNGGLRTLSETVADFPAYTIESGPVAGALGAEYFARSFLETNNLVCMDIGGTSTDIAFVVEAKAEVTEEWQFEFNVPLGMPAIDVRSLGAGGGSIIGVDDIGTLRVGPESAGAMPGPAAYGRGGQLPTITDAYVVLGWVQPQLFLRGELELDAEAAHAAMKGLARQLRLDPVELGAGAIQLMNVHIENEISKMAFERALDLRDFSLLAYGGAGPIHAAHVARSLGLADAIIPFFPGGFSALGMVTAPVKAERAVSVIEPLVGLGAQRLSEILRGLEERVVQDLGRQSVAAADIRFESAMYGMYEGQSFDNRVMLPAGRRSLSDEDVAVWVEDFHHLYERVYGYSAREMGIVITTVTVTGLGPQVGIPLPEQELGPPEPHAEAIELRATMFVDGEFRDGVPFYIRDRLAAGNVVDGPAVIDDGLSTVLVPTGAHARIDRFGGIHIGF